MTVAPLDPATPSMMDMLAPTLCVAERSAVLIAPDGRIAAVVVNEREPERDEMVLAACVCTALHRGLLVLT